MEQFCFDTVSCERRIDSPDFGPALDQYSGHLADPNPRWCVLRLPANPVSPGSIWTPNGTLRTFPMKIRTLAIGQASWAQRNPILSFRFVGVFLFRFADRTLSGSLFQDPPRITKSDRPRMEGLSPATFCLSITSNVLGVHPHLRWCRPA